MPKSGYKTIEVNQLDMPIEQFSLYLMFMDCKVCRQRLEAIKKESIGLDRKCPMFLWCYDVRWIVNESIQLCDI
jgi:hypothetical protein